MAISFMRTTAFYHEANLEFQGARLLPDSGVSVVALGVELFLQLDDGVSPFSVETLRLPTLSWS